MQLRIGNGLLKDHSMFSGTIVRKVIADLTGIGLKKRTVVGVCNRGLAAHDCKRDGYSLLD